MYELQVSLICWCGFHFVFCCKETLDCLSELYSVLKEDDMWAGLWHKRCR